MGNFSNVINDVLSTFQASTSDVVVQNNFAHTGELSPLILLIPLAIAMVFALQSFGQTRK